MRACRECFRAEYWLGQIEEKGTVGECDFGHLSPPETWPVELWSKPLKRLLSFYEVDETDPGSGESAFSLIQKDWVVFSFNDENVISLFVREAVGPNPLLAPGASVRLKTLPGLRDHVALWEVFASELKQRNRFFPSTVLDLDDLERVFESASSIVSADERLFRSRQFDSARPVTPKDIGPPPPAEATAGRANPVGIPYLYLSFTEHTSLHEVRAPNQGEIVVGEFRVREDLKVLNLTSLEPPEAFVDDAVAGLHQYRYIRRLGQELGRPVKASDAQTDYVPTQFLCEYAKHLGFSGVIYPSAVDPRVQPGRNLVLFNPEQAEWTGLHTRYRVTKVEASFVKLGVYDS